MARIDESKIGETPFQKLLGHNSEIMERWNQLDKAFEGLSSKLREQVRRTLAQGNGCDYCKAKGKPDPLEYDEKTSIAVGFAEVFLKQKGGIANSTFDVLKESFSEKEISELCAFIAFTTASQHFGAMMKLEPSTRT
ncbi:carboxymuconolactone decarboxylase family protein [Geomicrobium sediminis]|uniref:Alkylhydroperoxidase family enzyme n=1 Tax=Geomicrobium sediminis TaxID=1347788 RepID=A0ABS2PDM0_9BACL|nr:carboxymuconolactone decarboxylase family protein [Geomicrobium sediminis]MBM7633226.1 alkylhydroperoxidase family enzyme [Geomicrobium sediminis]